MSVVIEMAACLLAPCRMAPNVRFNSFAWTKPDGLVNAFAVRRWKSVDEALNEALRECLKAPRTAILERDALTFKAPEDILERDAHPWRAFPTTYGGLPAQDILGLRERDCPGNPFWTAWGTPVYPPPNGSPDPSPPKPTSLSSPLPRTPSLPSSLSGTTAPPPVRTYERAVKPLYDARGEVLAYRCDGCWWLWEVRCLTKPIEETECACTDPEQRRLCL